MQYDPSREALYRPASKPAFVRVDSMPQFEADNLGFSPVNAWWLSNASHLAYFEPRPLEHALQRVGWRLIHFFSKKSTQAFLAASASLAVLAFRGTQIDDLDDLKADADICFTPLQNEAQVHRGFLAALDEVWPEVEEVLQEVTEQGLSIWYTGHSLGAALATLAATRIRPNALFAFGSPRVGNGAFAQLLDNVLVQRIVNCCDVIPAVPAYSLGYRHVGQLHFITSTGQVLLNPSPSQVFWANTVAVSRYWAMLPWFRRGIVKTRSFADHAIVNYSAALREAIAISVARRDNIS